MITDDNHGANSTKYCTKADADDKNSKNSGQDIIKKIKPKQTGPDC